MESQPVTTNYHKDILMYEYNAEAKAKDATAMKTINEWIHIFAKYYSSKQCEHLYKLSEEHCVNKKLPYEKE